MRPTKIDRTMLRRKLRASRRGRIKARNLLAAINETAAPRGWAQNKHGAQGGLALGPCFFTANKAASYISISSLDSADLPLGVIGRREALRASGRSVGPEPARVVRDEQRVPLGRRPVGVLLAAGSSQQPAGPAGPPGEGGAPGPAERLMLRKLAAGSTSHPAEILSFLNQHNMTPERLLGAHRRAGRFVSSSVLARGCVETILRQQDRPQTGRGGGQSGWLFCENK